MYCDILWYTWFTRTYCNILWCAVAVPWCSSLSHVAAIEEIVRCAQCELELEEQFYNIEEEWNEQVINIQSEWWRETVLKYDRRVIGRVIASELSEEFTSYTSPSIQVLQFSPYKSRGPLLLAGDHTLSLLERLEHAQTQLATMLMSRHILPLREEASQWAIKLATIAEVLHQVRGERGTSK